MKRKYAIKWYDELDSTNNEIVRNIGQFDNLSVAAARKQTAGRGQRGNCWKTEEGMNLTFSLLLRFSCGEHPGQDGRTGNGSLLTPLAAADQFAIIQTATLALHELLLENGIHARIKWPNDLYVGNRKICGMLIENSLYGKHISTSIIGIGLNVNQTGFPSDLPNPTSMTMETGKTWNLENLLTRYTGIFDGYLETLLSEHPVSRFTPSYLSAMYRLNEKHRFLDRRNETYTEAGNSRQTLHPSGNGNSALAGMDCSMKEESAEALFEGTIRGISDSGLLEIEMPDGSLDVFGFKEIGYII